MKKNSFVNQRCEGLFDFIRLFIGVLIVCVGAFHANHLLANPTGEQVVAGQATFDRTATDLTVTTGDRAIINWQGFSIDQGQLTKFMQPGAQSATLNRVLGGNPSSILGTLQANGQIYLINPNGVLVGPSGSIQTQKFVASTLDVTNDQFMAGNGMTFTGNSQAGVSNLGTIDGGAGGVYLIAREVENAGTIKGDSVGLAAGTEVLLKPVKGSEGIFVKAGPGKVANSGTIEATQAELKAVGGNVYALAVNNSGVVRATSLSDEGGQVWLRADGGKVQQSGSIVAQKAANGGNVEITGQDIEITSTATITADAQNNGNGGTINVIAQKDATFDGSISAKGAGTGSGGEVELSGYENLSVNGYVDLTSPSGSYGTLLLDPGTVWVVHGAQTGPNTFGDSYIITQLGLANLTIQTSAANGTNGPLQDIIVFGTGDPNGAASIVWNNLTKLEFRAGRMINLHPGALIQNTSTLFTGGYAIVMKGNYNGCSWGLLDSTGIKIDGATVQSTTGNIKLLGQGKGLNCPWSDYNHGVEITNGGQVISDGTGTYAANIIIKGTGGKGDDRNYGVYVHGTDSKVSTVDGDICIEGQGGLGYGEKNKGVVIKDGGQVVSTGTGVEAGVINIRGTGGSGTNHQTGIFIDPADVQSVDGNINLFGVGGTGVNGQNYGIHLHDGGKVVTTGSANILLDGLGYNGAAGIKTDGSPTNKIGGPSATGNITLNADVMELCNLEVQSTGTLFVMPRADATSMGLGDGAAGTLQLSNLEMASFLDGFEEIFFGRSTSTSVAHVNNLLMWDPTTVRMSGIGGTVIVDSSTNIIWDQPNWLKLFGGRRVFVMNGANLESTSDAFLPSDTTMYIQSNNGGMTPGNFVGTEIQGSLKANSGNIQVFGQGGNSASTNRGILLTNGGTIASTGTGANAAKILLKGTGGNGVNANHGVMLSGNNVMVSSIRGEIAVQGVGQGSGNFNHGISMTEGSRVVSTGVGANAANIVMNGTGGGTSTSYGVFLTGVAPQTEVTSIDGNINVTGKGGNSVIPQVGIHQDMLGQIHTTGTGVLTLTAIP